MSAVTTVALPIFALLFSGYGASRAGLLAGPAIVGLNGFVYWFALPALLLTRVAESTVLGALDWRMLAAYHGGGLLVFGAAMAAGRLLFRRPLVALGLRGLAASWGNVGYMGLPLALTAFGEAATVPSVLIVVSDIAVTFSLAVAVTEAGLGAGGRWSAVAGTIGRGLGTNPVLLAAVAGAALSIAGLPLPAPLRVFGNLLGAAALPCALFALGAALAGRVAARQAAEVGVLVGLKLLVHPVAVGVLASQVFVVDPLWARVAVIDAALPTAATVFVLAQRYDLEVETASGVVLVSTLGSVASVSVLLALLAGP